jgi:uncharacterized membrane protein
MDNRRLGLLSVAGALAGAVTLASAAYAAHNPMTPEKMGARVKCYGIALAGQNDCANAAGTHSCAGHSAAGDYDGGEWKAVTAGECDAMHGKLEPFQGKNPDI